MTFRPPLLPDRRCRRLDVPAAGGTALGILFADAGFSWLPATLTALAAILLIFVLLPWRRGIVLLAFLLLGAGLFLWQKHPAADSCEAQLAGRDAGGEIEVRIVESGLTPLPFLPPPTLIRAELRSFRLVGEAERRPASGILYLTFPGEPPAGLMYGDTLIAEGAFHLPRAAAVMVSVNDAPPELCETGRGFARYLRSRGASAAFRAESWRKTGRESGWMGRLLALRDRAAARLTAGLGPGSVRREAAALFFGCRSGLARAGRLASIRAGTIHLFSVSGLHVGVLGGLLLFCCRWLPYRWRYLVPPLPLLAYVLTTGAQPPALRAWVMITAWSLLRAGLMWMPASAVLAWTAALLLWLNPASLFDAGFLYSFVITAALLLLNERYIGDGRAPDPLPLMPVSPLRRRAARQIRLRSRLIGAAGAAVTAFLGGALISGFFRGEFFWASIPANLLLLSVLALLFPLAALKLLFGTGWLASIPSAALEGCWRVMAGVTAWAAACDSASGCDPAWWQLALFYGGVAALLLPRLDRRVRIVGGVAAGLVMLGIVLTPLTARPALLFCTGGGAEYPLFAVADTRAGLGVAANAPIGGSVAEAVAFFQRRGIVRLAEFQVGAPRAGAIGALRELIGRLPVERMSLPPRDRYDRRFRALLAAAAEETGGTSIGFAPEGGLLVADRASFRYVNPASGVTASAVRAGAAWEIEFNGKHRRFVPTGSSIPECRIYE